MSEFADKVKEFQKQMRIEMGLDYEEDPEDYFKNATYTIMCSSGFCRSYTMRLPVHMIAQLDELKKYSPFSSKGEMIYKMLESQISEFYEDDNCKYLQDSLSEVSKKALDEVNESNKNTEKSN